MSEKKGADAYAHTGTLAFLLSCSALVSYGNMVFAASEDKAVAGEEIKLTKEEKEIIKDSVEEIQLFIDEIHPFDCKDNVIYSLKIKSVCSVKSADFRVDTGSSKEDFTMDNFELVSEYKSTGYQLQAIIALVKGFQEGNQYQF